MEGKWYNIAKSNNAINVDLYGDIGGYGITAEEFIAEVSPYIGQELILNISSLGGAINDALQIYDFLSSAPNKITAKITGLTASSATIVAMAADKVLMSENALFLVHNVWTPMTSGNAADLEKEAESLRQIDDLLVNIYKKKTKKRRNAILNLMAEERWLNAEEALDWGLIDKMYIPSKEIMNALVLNKINEENLPELPKNYIGQADKTNREESDIIESEIKFNEMNLEKINAKIDLIINKMESLFIKEEKEVETADKAEVEATLNAEITELKNLYEFQLETQDETIKMAKENLEEKNAEIAELKNSFEESLKELNEKVEKLEAKETMAVKEEDATIAETATESNPFDGLAEKLRR